jgi:hypothetical protein
VNELFAIVVPLSLGAAVSPTALAVVILTLSGKVAPRARAWAEVAGFTVTLIALTVLLAVFAQAILSFKPDPIVLGSTDVVAGLALLGLAVHTVLRRKDGSGKARHKKAPGDKAGPALGAYFAIGVALLLTDVTSLVLYLPALKDIAQAKDVPSEAKLAIAAIPFFAVIAPMLIPSVLASVAPAMTDRVLKPFGAWVDGHSRAIGLVIEIVFGVALLIKGGVKLYRG